MEGSRRMSKWSLPHPSLKKHSFFFVPMTNPHGDCLITPTLKNPHQNECKQTETFTFKTLELNYHLQGDVWGQSSIHFQLPEDSKKNLLPIFLHPSWSSAFWDMTLRVINARSTCFPGVLTKCFTVLAAVSSAATCSGFTSISLFILDFGLPFFPFYWVIYDSEWCV